MVLWSADGFIYLTGRQAIVNAVENSSSFQNSSQWIVVNFYSYLPIIWNFADVYTMVCTVGVHVVWIYSKTCLKGSLKKKTKIGFQDRLSLNAGQKYCRMLQEEHSAILSTFIKLPFVINIFVLSIFEWPLKTGFTVILIDFILNF